MFHPIAGVIFQILGGIESHIVLVPPAGRISVPLEISLNVTGVFTQFIVLGEIVKSVLTGNEIYIGSTEPAETPQGFSAIKFAENELLKIFVPSVLVVPQDVLEKICGIPTGGG